MSRKKRSSPSLGFRIGASAVVLVLFLVLAEGGARWLGPELPARRAEDRPGTLLVGHESRLWGVAPGVNANGHDQATVDAIGLRAPIPQGARAPGAQRVLVLGDSSIFGHGVADDATLPAWLQAELASRGVDAQVINGGIPGYSTEQSRVLLDEVGWGLEPTLLVVANLWSDNNFDLWHDADLLHTARFARDNPLHRSAFYTLVASALDRVAGGSGARIITWTRTSGAPSGDVVRRVPVRAYAANLDRIARDAADHGAGVAFLALANRDVVLDTFDVGSWDIYLQAQSEVAAHHGAVRVAAKDALKGAMAEGATLDDLFVDELHPSGAGHHIIATALADALVAAGWPQAPQLATGDGAFDPSSLDDAWTTQATAGNSRGSPQQQLVSAMEPPADAGAAGARTMVPGAAGSSVGEAPPRPTPPPGPTAPSREAAAPWWVEGTVQSASHPDDGVLIELRAGDRVLSSARLRRSGPFRLRVTGDRDAVQVVATDGSGASVRADVDPSSGTVELALP